MDPISAAISAGGSFLGGILGFGSQQSANEQNMEIAKYNWEQQKLMWREQNEYNKPSSQMARLKEAGLNPNLIYGNGSAATGNSTSTPTPSVPRVEPLTNGSFLASAGQQIADQMRVDKLADAEIRNKDSLSKYNDTKNSHETLMMWLTEERALGQAIENTKSELERDMLRDTYNTRRQYYEEQLNGLRLSNELSRLDNFYKSSTIEDRIEMAKIETSIKRETINDIKSRTRLNNAKVNEVASIIQKISSEISLNNAKTLGQKWDNKLKIDTFGTQVKKVNQDFINSVLSGDKTRVDAFIKANGLDSRLASEAWGIFNIFNGANDNKLNPYGASY